MKKANCQPIAKFCIEDFDGYEEVKHKIAFMQGDACNLPINLATTISCLPAICWIDFTIQRDFSS